MAPTLIPLHDTARRIGEPVGLSALLGSMLPYGVAFAGGRLDHPNPTRFEVEETAIARASESRRQEFIAGRSYARTALAALGCQACPIPVNSDRRPVWPDGYIGSISHTRCLCAAIAARNDDYHGLGIDVETEAGLEPELQRIILRPEERSRATISRTSERDLAKLVFVAKEAVFKAYYPATSTFLDFPDVLVEFDPSCQRFRARLTADHAPGLAGRRCFEGRIGWAEAHVVAVVAIARAAR
jgi:4'-phosphopantetheinyl transferase EntD